ncbi:hypothetical protein [Bacillus sp. IBL03825]|uniref:hypothetical protein n=1 Tax=Bacillus sp. IBL03825 TaxID=2953580 RepID=UPI0028046C3E|nr:hypothetical protein [Bacillus sp. IBL03825]
MHTKTLTEYKSDLEDFIFWFEHVWGNISEETFFRTTEITARTFARYREHIQIPKSLNPATINRRINSIKCYFNWEKEQGVIQTNYSKSIKFVPTVKTSPKQMTVKENASLIILLKNTEHFVTKP